MDYFFNQLNEIADQHRVACIILVEYPGPVLNKQNKGDKRVVLRNLLHDSPGRPLIRYQNVVIKSATTPSATKFSDLKHTYNMFKKSGNSTVSPSISNETNGKVEIQFNTISCVKQSPGQKGQRRTEEKSYFCVNITFGDNPKEVIYLN